MTRPSWAVIDSDTGQTVRRHAQLWPLRAWAWYMNQGEGRERYYVAVDE